MVARRRRWYRTIEETAGTSTFFRMEITIMELQFALSGSVIFSIDGSSVPEMGARLVFRTQTHKKGIAAGTLVAAVVSGKIENEYDYTAPGSVVVRIDVNPVSPVEQGGQD